ncbi:AvrD family protein [Microbacterium sp. 22215]|uniref:AvrD family protein n=1 Tax=Microbacterium sp. 22215 TaxID=3453893 RepID=UPI003F85AFC1
MSELLGDADQRYFGDGYRAVQQDLRNLRLRHVPGSGWRIEASLALRYPDSWSTKSGQANRSPHLSTLDAFVVAAQLAEAMLVGGRGLEPAQRPWVWLHRALIRAGAKAVEELDEIDVSGQMSVGQPLDNPLLSNSQTFTAKFTIGALRVELDLVAPAGESRDVGESFPDIDDLLGAKKDRYYGEGFKRDRLTIGDGWLSDDTTIQVPVTRTRGTKSADIGSAYTVSPTFVNCILGQAQVSQLMLYSLDHIDRATSDNLWMRHVELVSDGPDLHSANEFVAEAQVIRTRLIPMSHRTWRVTDFSGRFGPISARYNLAHALPELTGTPTE